MAKQNYTLVLTDTTDGGVGPYTGTLFLNPTTAAAGGTQTTLVYAPGAYGVKDLINRYSERIADNNAQLFDIDTEN